MGHSLEMEAIVVLTKRQGERFGHPVVGIEHLILALAAGGNSLEARALYDAKLDEWTLRRMVIGIHDSVHVATSWSLTNAELNPEVTAVAYLYAAELAEKEGEALVQPRHLLEAALDRRAGRAFVGGRPVTQLVKRSLQHHRGGVRFAHATTP